MKLETLLAEKPIKIESVLAFKPKFDPKNPYFNAKKDQEWKENSFHWIVTLTYNGKSFTTDYYMGMAHISPECPIKNIKTLYDVQMVEEWYNGSMMKRAAKPTAPDIKDILYSLILDSTACNMSFQEWCAELGFDTDSIKDKGIYEACQVIGFNLKKLLGKDYTDFINSEMDY